MRRKTNHGSWDIAIDELCSTALGLYRLGHLVPDSIAVKTPVLECATLAESGEWGCFFPGVPALQATPGYFIRSASHWKIVLWRSGEEGLLV